MIAKSAQMRWSTNPKNEKRVEKIVYIHMYICIVVVKNTYIDVRSTAADPSFETAMCGKRYGRLEHVSSLAEQAKT